MNAKLPTSHSTWVDPDDAQELTPAWFEKAVPMVAGKPVTAVAFAGMTKRMIGRPRVEVKRPMVSMRLDPDVLAALRASGKGWQTRVNAVLRDAVVQGRM